MAKKENVKKVKEEKDSKKLTQEEYEKKGRGLEKEGLTSEKIGQKLRDTGIHPKEYSGKISSILGNSYINPDLKNVEAKLERIGNHNKKNKQDKRAEREKNRVFAQLRKLKKYLGIEVR